MILSSSEKQSREKCVFIYLQQDYFVGLFPPIGGELVTLPGSAYDWGPVAAAAAPSTARLHPPAPVRNMQRVCGRWSVVALNATYTSGYNVRPKMSSCHLDLIYCLLSRLQKRVAKIRSVSGFCNISLSSLNYWTAHDWFLNLNANIRRLSWKGSTVHIKCFVLFQC